MKTGAGKALKAARAATPASPVGTAKFGSVVITWDRRVSIYTVGTDTVDVAAGKRSEVHPFVAALLAGCSTRLECETWILGMPERARIAAATGARLPAGTVRAA